MLRGSRLGFGARLSTFAALIARLLNGRHIDFIKIDTEGMEIDVLKGLQDTIATCRPTMFVEVDHQNGDAFRAFLRRSGYVVRDQFSRYDSFTNFLVSRNG